jgi:hypothetical protein
VSLSMIALALLVSASSSSAEVPSKAASANTYYAANGDATEVEKKKPKKICKPDPRVTGTRIAKRICKTAEEWNVNEDGQELEVRRQN